MSLPIQTLPATPADALTMVDIMDSAFEPTYHYQRMYPSNFVPEEDKCQRIEMMQKNIVSNKHARLFKAVIKEYDDDNSVDNDDEAMISNKVIEGERNRNELGTNNMTETSENEPEPDKTVGWAQWKIYYVERQEEEWRDNSKNEDEDIEGMDVGYVNWFFGTMEENRQRLFGGMPYCSKCLKKMSSLFYSHKLLVSEIWSSVEPDISVSISSPHCDNCSCYSVYITQAHSLTSKFLSSDTFN